MTWKFTGPARFPLVSAALQVTVVEPTGKTEPDVSPDAELQAAANPVSMLSVTAGAVKLTVAPLADVDCAVTSA